MKIMPVMTVVALALISGSALAASPEPPGGAASCSACHATSSAVETPMPKIYGRSAEETVAAFKAFRSGARPSTVMGRIAKGYTDEEVSAVAAWLATQKQEGAR